MRTPLCDLLGIEHPVIQAAIGGISCPALAAAVSNAGALGSIAMTGWGEAGVRQRLEQVRAMTNQGCVANVLLPYDVSSEIKAILAAPPKVVSFFWGDVSPYISRVHDAGSLVMVTVGSVDEAKMAAEAGADMVVAQGWEAGGHVRGTTATMALVPAVVDAVAPIPVIAAGGISDGRGLAAALCLGAQAAWIGTRFLAAKEADIHPDYQSRVFSATSHDTFYSTLFDGGWPDAPGRVLNNETTEKWVAAGKPESGKRPNEDEVIAHDSAGNPIKRYAAYAMRSEMRGNIQAAPLWAGQGVGLVRQSQSAAEIVAELVRGTRRALGQFNT